MRSEAWKVYLWEPYPLDNSTRPSRLKASLCLVCQKLRFRLFNCDCAQPPQRGILLVVEWFKRWKKLMLETLLDHLSLVGREWPLFCYGGIGWPRMGWWKSAKEGVSELQPVVRKGGKQAESCGKDCAQNVKSAAIQSKYRSLWCVLSVSAVSFRIQRGCKVQCSLIWGEVKVQLSGWQCLLFC